MSGSGPPTGSGDIVGEGGEGWESVTMSFQLIFLI